MKIAYALLVAIITPCAAGAQGNDSSASSIGLAEAPATAFDSRRTRQLLAAQILLDRTRFSPGVIDGLGGANVAHAVRAFRQAHGLPDGDRIDERLIAKLQEVATGPVLIRHTVTEADLGGPYLPSLPKDFAEQAKLEHVGYTSAQEALAERFHMSEELLRALNPGVEFGKPGAQILVPASRGGKIEGDVARIEVDKKASAVRVFGADKKLLAIYPATIGSADMPSPEGSMQVEAVAKEAAYYFDPDKLGFGPDKKLQIPAGPNNPVGGVWIDLSKEGYGIHGAPEPRLIRKTSSHGCVRLTNWDAHELAEAVKPGVVVEFTG
jgi:lipoprotein-anchoring transpeptidase ErfK/SrfK